MTSEIISSGSCVLAGVKVDWHVRRLAAGQHPTAIVTEAPGVFYPFGNRYQLVVPAQFCHRPLHEADSYIMEAVKEYLKRFEAYLTDYIVRHGAR